MLQVDFEYLLEYINKRNMEGINSILNRYGLQNSKNLRELIERLTAKNYGETENS